MIYFPFFPLSMLALAGILFIVLFGLVFLVFWIWAIIDCLNSKLNPAEKVLWILVMFFLNVLGAALYLIFGRHQHAKKRLSSKKLFRSKHNRVVAGVCGGLGEYLGVDPTLIRLIWVLVVVFSGFFPGILAYIICWIVIPEP